VLPATLADKKVCPTWQGSHTTSEVTEGAPTWMVRSKQLPHAGHDTSLSESVKVPAEQSSQVRSRMAVPCCETDLPGEHVVMIVHAPTEAVRSLYVLTPQGVHGVLLSLSSSVSPTGHW